MNADAICSGRFFKNLYLFWLLILSDGRPVKAFPFVAPTYSIRKELPIEWKAWAFTSVGMLCFSGTFACTRLALTAFDPFVIAFVRGAGAGVAALACILATRVRLPSRHQLVRLSGAALGMVVG